MEDLLRWEDLLRSDITIADADDSGDLTSIPDQKSADLDGRKKLRQFIKYHSVAAILSAVDSLQCYKIVERDRVTTIVMRTERGITMFGSSVLRSAHSYLPASNPKRCWETWSVACKANHTSGWALNPGSLQALGAQTCQRFKPAAADNGVKQIASVADPALLTGIYAYSGPPSPEDECAIATALQRCLWTPRIAKVTGSHAAYHVAALLVWGTPKLPARIHYSSTAVLTGICQGKMGSFHTFTPPPKKRIRRRSGGKRGQGRKPSANKPSKEAFLSLFMASRAVGMLETALDVEITSIETNIGVIDVSSNGCLVHFERRSGKLAALRYRPRIPPLTLSRSQAVCSPEISPPRRLPADVMARMQVVCSPGSPPPRRDDGWYPNAMGSIAGVNADGGKRFVVADSSQGGKADFTYTYVSDEGTIDFNVIGSDTSYGLD